ncbi:hypothetical protein BJ969_003540 [Saccharopolyspora gloriosae]|uniref:Tetratricopeptide repeat protein n=1 Tax=Saccharopolyspora gloriosae TaxID=455344 RepID=A0A840NMY0_9PSEU|nr:hypothetical protein [Saccharopolyspora gloriosae]
MNNSVSEGTVDSLLQAGQVRDVYLGGVRRVQWPQRVGVIPARVGSFQHRDLTALPDHTAGAGAAWVLSGMGGVGKTQAAADYAQRAWSTGVVELVVWVDASSRAAILATYAAAANQLGWHTGQQTDLAATRFLDGLAVLAKPWLVVLDDLESPGVVSGLWPPATLTGRVVATTRRREDALTGHLRTLISVGVFTPTESLRYLADRFGHESSRLAEAADLAVELGHLPLALSQATAYIVDEDLDCRGYRRLLADRRQKLVELVPEPDALPDDHRNPITGTWSLSVALADRQRPRGLAPRVLEVAALLDANGIPVELFTTRAVQNYLTHQLGREVTGHAIRSAWRVLHRLNLITDNPSESPHTIRIHGLVQRVAREELTESQFAGLARVAADALGQIWPEIERDRLYARLLRVNASALHNYAIEQLNIGRVHPILFRLGRSLHESGLLKAAIDHYRDLCITSARSLGRDHPDTLTARDNLASARSRAGDAASAAEDCARLLADRVRVFGPDHPDTLTTRHNLASSRGRAGDVAGAMEECERLLADRTRVLGSDHPDTLATRSGLAVWRGRAGDAAGAVTAFEELFADRLRILGPDHRATLASRGNLSSWRGKAGDVAGAVKECERLLADRTRVLGSDHPDTLITRSNLAWWHGVAGDVAGAAEESEHVLADRTRVLGTDHPDTDYARAMRDYWSSESSTD